MEAVPPHFHKDDRISEIDLIPDGAVYTALPESAEEGRFAVKKNGSVWELHRFLDGAWRLLANGAHSFVGCRVYHSTTETYLNATIKTQPWDTESFDTNAMHDTATNNTRITIPSDGYYAVRVLLTIDPDDSAERHLWVRKNGSTNVLHWSGQGVNNSQYQSIPLFGVLSLLAGDYLEVRFEQNVGTSLNSREGADRSFFEVYKLG